MASGSQVWSGNWPLLPMMPMNRQMAPASSSEWSACGLRAYRLMTPMLKLPAAKKVMMIPIIRPMSPVRVVRNALSAARLFASSSHQWPMSAKEQSPTPSQPTSNCSVLSDTTSSSIAAVNRLSIA